MTTATSLSQPDRDFFTLVMNATLANPFSDNRMEADLKIAGLFPKARREIILEHTIQAVRQRIEQLGRKGTCNLALYREPDRTILRAAFMFDFFHAWCSHFDAMIDQQAAIPTGQTDAPKKVRFAEQALSQLSIKGFDQEEAVHLFSLCFQLRRAFYFIDKNLVGRSPCMIKLRESLWNNVFTGDLLFYSRHLWNKMEDFSTLIIGETGCGKGTAANAIGRSGFIPFNLDLLSFDENFTRSFVSLNISQFPENLIESELFGHKKGSFTGAVDHHEGVFARCSPYGAIFLDEIGEVSVPIQIKLLKVLEERVFSPVGSRESHRFMGRIITATNRNLDELVDPDIIRKDFYYRLCSDIIMVPPLRQRIQEDPDELDRLLKHRLTAMIGSDPDPMLSLLRLKIRQGLGRHYSWPGNVRELEQVTRRVLLDPKGDMTMDSGIPGDKGRKRYAKDLARAMADGSIKAHDLLKAYCFNLYKEFGTIGEVARRTHLDRRTVKKYCDEWATEGKTSF